jgi:hypothetical protein
MEPWIDITIKSCGVGAVDLAIITILLRTAYRFLNETQDPTKYRDIPKKVVMEKTKEVEGIWRKLGIWLCIMLVPVFCFFSLSIVALVIIKTSNASLKKAPQVQISVLSAEK